MTQNNHIGLLCICSVDLRSLSQNMSGYNVINKLWSPGESNFCYWVPCDIFGSEIWVMKI